MKAKIGVADADRIIEAVFDNPAGFQASIEEAFEKDLKILWVTDTDNNRVAIPVRQIAWIEIEPAEKQFRVGFGD